MRRRRRYQDGPGGIAGHGAFEPGSTCSDFGLAHFRKGLLPVENSCKLNEEIGNDQAAAVILFRGIIQPVFVSNEILNKKSRPFSDAWPVRHLPSPASFAS